MKSGRYEQLSAQLSDLKYELDLWRLQFYIPESLIDKAEKINRLNDIKEKLNSNKYKSQSESLESLRKAMLKDINNTQNLKYYKDIERKIETVTAIYTMAYSNFYKDINLLKRGIDDILRKLALDFDDFSQIMNMNFANYVNIFEGEQFENEGQLIEYAIENLKGLYDSLMVDEDEVRPFNIYEKIIITSVLEEVKLNLENGY